MEGISKHRNIHKRMAYAFQKIISAFSVPSVVKGIAHAKNAEFAKGKGIGAFLLILDPKCCKLYIK